MRALAFLFASALLVAQPKFEVASIKADNSNANRVVQFGANTLTIVNLPLANIMFQAYDLEPRQFSFGDFTPQFTQRYDIIAKSSGQVSRAQMQLMLQALLADRFHMAVHHEQKAEQVYALVVERAGHKLKPPASPDREGDFDKHLSAGEQRQSIQFHNASMQMLSQVLMETANLSKFRPGEPDTIVDRTGLRGGFDFELEWLPEQPQPGDTIPPDRLPALIGALHKVGLTLKSDKASIDHLVIDHIDKVPAEN